MIHRSRTSVVRESRGIFQYRQFISGSWSDPGIPYTSPISSSGLYIHTDSLCQGKLILVTTSERDRESEKERKEERKKNQKKERKKESKKERKKEKKKERKIE